MFLESHWLVYGLLASIIASVHLWIGWFEARFERYENLWIGFIGGIAAGYVTLYMLPKLSDATSRFIVANPEAWSVFQYRAYFILLLGIVVYLIFERASRFSASGGKVARGCGAGSVQLSDRVRCSRVAASRGNLSCAFERDPRLTPHGYDISLAYPLSVRSRGRVARHLHLAGRVPVNLIPPENRLDAQAHSGVQTRQVRFPGAHPVQRTVPVRVRIAPCLQKQRVT
ncbi:MAG: hypothetical protein O7E57_03340, partial [Gammaproteobacteria bacterium]|nr:hypothetical protein [Gammaproteobacteria bacterium]